MSADPVPRKRNTTRERRILDEIIADANGPEEQAMGWYHYLDNTLRFPFRARCRTACAISPLHLSEHVLAVAMAPEEECLHEMFVRVRWQDRFLAVPLAQLEVRGAGGGAAKTR